ncbi:MAG: deoxyribose-phosphate aldolase [Ignavibacteria bacterium]|nr:deoxyribose-phosphate aldolase [Ignavibacteria bacterium]
MQLASSIDHTLLKPNATAVMIETLCAEAMVYSFASVCVNPCYVALSSRLLRTSNVKVCTVIGFPLGASTTESKVFEAENALAHGASELDMVIAIGHLISGDDDAVRKDIASVVRVAHAQNAIVKVIIETCLLTDEQKIRACALVTEAGADFIKTSTGFSTGGATLEDIELLRKHVGKNVRVKASGGIRDIAFAESLLLAGAERIGTSSGVSMIKELEKREL